MTTVEWLVEKLNKRWYGLDEGETWNDLIQKALEMEKQERQKVDKLLDTLLENNMCSHAGDKLIEQFKTTNQ